MSTQCTTNEHNEVKTYEVILSDDFKNSKNILSIVTKSAQSCYERTTQEYNQVQAYA